MSETFIQINKTTNTVKVPATVLADLYAGYLMGRVGKASPIMDEVRAQLFLTIADWVETIGVDAILWLIETGPTTLKERGDQVIQRERDKKEQSNESV